MHTAEKSESDLFEWLADYQDDVGILCETHPRLSQLIDKYIALLETVFGLKEAGPSEQQSVSEHSTLKAQIFYALGYRPSQGSHKSD